jgi:adenylate cyclase
MTRQIRFGGWCFDPDTHLLAMGGERHVLEPRVARLLEYLLLHPCETLSHDQLVEAVWDGRVVSDEAVRRAVSTLRHALAADGSDRCIRTVHKKGYVALFDDPEPEAAAPAAHSTPEAPQGYQPPPWQRIAWALSVVCLVSALALTLPEHRRDSTPLPEPHTAATPAAPTLAVLPFLDLGSEPGNDYLSHGLSEELLNTLARHQGLDVTARASAFRFRDSQLDARELGRRLGVRYLLQGSVRAVAGQVRIEARLSDAASGRKLWSGSYERTLTELFAVQEEIATEVAQALELAPVAPRTGNPGAHAASVEPQPEMALALAQERSPSHARGYEALATRLMGIPGRQAEALQLIDRALALDPLTPRNHHTKAIFLAQLGDADGAEALERRALELDPRFLPAQLWLGKLGAMRGEFAQAVDHGERALAIDPRATFLRSELVHFYLDAGDDGTARLVDSPATPNGRLALLLYEANWNAAVDWIDQAEASASRSGLASHLVSCARLQQGLATGRPAQAASTLAAELGFDGNRPELAAPGEFRAYADLAQLLHASGDEATARRLRQLVEAELDALEVVSPGQRRVIDASRAVLLAQARRDGDAVEALERSYAAAPLPLWWIHLKHPAFDGLRGQSQFRGLVARVQAQLATQRETLAQMRRRGLVPDRAAQNQR